MPGIDQAPEVRLRVVAFAQTSGTPWGRVVCAAATLGVTIAHAMRQHAIDVSRFAGDADWAFHERASPRLPDRRVWGDARPTASGGMPDRRRLGGYPTDGVWGENALFWVAGYTRVY